MKSLFIGAMIVFCSLEVAAQWCFPARKVYAYFQPVLRGIAARENGRLDAPQGNHLVFVESRKEGLAIDGIWIDGTYYAAALKKVETPVNLPRQAAPNGFASEQPLELVPATENRVVYQVILTGADSGSRMKPGDAPARGVAVPLTFKKKTKTLSVDSIRTLPVSARF